MYFYRPIENDLGKDEASRENARFSRYLVECYQPTEHTRGPWSPEVQHGGPPSALIAHAFERVAPEGFSGARLTFEMMRPVGLAPMRLEAWLLRAGSRAAWVEATLSTWDKAHGTRECIRARGVWIRPEPLELLDTPEDKPPPPEALTSPPMPPVPWSPAYHLAMQFLAGHWNGRRIAWLRPLGALCEGLSWSPLTRLVVATDSIGGLFPALDFRSHTYVNAELTCHLVRPLVGDWVGLSGSTRVSELGVGLASATFYDALGAFGEGAQSQVVARRQAGLS
jgi:hypothetical protein